MNNKKSIITLYEETLPDYEFFYSNKEALGLHYGYWDKTVKNLNQAVVRLNAIIAPKLSITKKSRVLDAGCGIGGSSFWFAKHIGCHITGISITPGHIRRAKELATKKNLNELTEFIIGDYTKTSFPDNTFDAVFAIETICHLDDKTPFYKEMYRILKPGGKILVADGVTTKEQMTTQEYALLKKWLDCWAVSDNMWTTKNHQNALKDTGFSHIHTEDYSKYSESTARILYLLSLFGVPVYWLLYKVCVISKPRLDHMLGCLYQWRPRKKGLWGHAMVWATKPTL